MVNGAQVAEHSTEQLRNKALAGTIFASLVQQHTDVPTLADVIGQIGELLVEYAEMQEAMFGDNKPVELTQH